MQTSPLTATFSDGEADQDADPDSDAVARAVRALARTPAGPRLCAVLASLDPATLTGSQWVDVLVARQRQGNYERGELFAAVTQVMLHRAPDSTAVAKVPDEFAPDEVRAAMTLTRAAALDLCTLVWDLHARMPEVGEAMRSGRIDQPRARVFSAWTIDLSDAHTNAVVAALLAAGN